MSDRKIELTSLIKPSKENGNSAKCGIENPILFEGFRHICMAKIIWNNCELTRLSTTNVQFSSLDDSTFPKGYAALAAKTQKVTRLIY